MSRVPFYEDINADALKNAVASIESDALVGDIPDDLTEDFCFFVRDGHETRGDRKGVLCPGSIMMSKGWVKSGKSRTNAMYLASYLNKDGMYWDYSTIDPLVTCTLPNRSRWMVQIDAELSKRELWQVSAGMTKSAGFSKIQADRHRILSVKKTTRGLRAAALKMIVEQYAESRQGMAVLSIDVGPAFIRSINDHEECGEFWDMLEMLTETYDLCTFMVMHMNKKDSFAAGVFGNNSEGKMSYGIDISIDRQLTTNQSKIIDYNTYDRRTSQIFAPKKLTFNEQTGMPMEYFGHKNQ